jgi:hypothetical protein
MKILFGCWLAVLLLLYLALPAAAQAQFTFVTNNGAVTITGYTGSGGEVVIPSATNGLPITVIGYWAFSNCTSVTSVIITNGVTVIEGFEPGGNGTGGAFDGCTSLTNVMIGSSVNDIGINAFASCTSLISITVDTNNPTYSSVSGILFDKGQTTLMQYPEGNADRCYTIPDSVTNIAPDAFVDCIDLTSITIGNGVTDIMLGAFTACTGLTSIFFSSNAPSLNPDLDGPLGTFWNDTATVYYLPGTTGWGATFGGLQTALWLPQAQTRDAAFGVRTNQFGFNINWASGQAVVVEACTNLANPIWQPVQTNTLTCGSSYFSDSQWINYSGRFYRLRSP